MKREDWIWLLGGGLLLYLLASRQSTGAGKAPELAGDGLSPLSGAITPKAKSPSPADGLGLRNGKGPGTRNTTTKAAGSTSNLVASILNGLSQILSKLLNGAINGSGSGKSGSRSSSSSGGRSSGGSSSGGSSRRDGSSVGASSVSNNVVVNDGTPQKFAIAPVAQTGTRAASGAATDYSHYVIPPPSAADLAFSQRMGDTVNPFTGGTFKPYAGPDTHPFIVDTWNGVGWNPAWGNNPNPHGGGGGNGGGGSGGPPPDLSGLGGGGGTTHDSSHDLNFDGGGGGWGVITID